MRAHRPNNPAVSAARLIAAPLALALGLALAGPAAASHPPGAQQWGNPIHVNEAGEIIDRPVVRVDRTVVVEPGMRNARVQVGETVRFVVRSPGGVQESFFMRFPQNFQRASERLELRAIAPADIRLPADAHIWLDPDPSSLG